MANPPRWFQSIVTVEIFLQLPFFFVAAYGFWHGVCVCVCVCVRRVCV
jgi:hypothetical protein